MPYLEVIITHSGGRQVIAPMLRVDPNRGSRLTGSQTEETFLPSSGVGVLEDTVKIEGIVGQTVDICQFTIYDKYGGLADMGITVPTLADVSVNWVLDPGEAAQPGVSPGRPAVVDKLFGGIIAHIMGEPDGFSRRWHLSCQDYTILLDRSLVLDRFPAGFTYDGLIGDRALITNVFETAVLAADGSNSSSEIWTRGTTVGGVAYVQQGLSSLSQQDFRFSTLREVMSQLSQYVGYDFYVDYGGVDYVRGSRPTAMTPRNEWPPALHYFYREDDKAPYYLTDGDPSVMVRPPDYTEDIAGVNYRGAQWKRDGTRVVNTYALFGDRLLADDSVAILRGTGSQREFNLGLEEIGRNVVMVSRPGETSINVDINAGADKTLSVTAHTGSNGAVTLTNASATFQTDGVVVGDVVLNVTDGSWGEVRSVTQTTITASLRQGTRNNWNSGDVIRVPTWRAINVDNNTTTTEIDGDVKHRPVEQTLVFVTAPPNDRAAVRIRYTYSFVGSHYGRDDGSIMRYGRVLSRRVVASDINSAQALVQKLAWMLEQYSDALEVVTCKVTDDLFPESAESIPPRFQAGQWVRFTNNVMGVQDRDMLIHRLSVKILGAAQREYECELRDWEVDL